MTGKDIEPTEPHPEVPGNTLEHTSCAHYHISPSAEGWTAWAKFYDPSHGL